MTNLGRKERQGTVSSDACEAVLPMIEDRIDRRLVVPFQSSGAEADERVVRGLAAALAGMERSGEGVIFLGSIAGDLARFVPRPFFPPEPLGFAVAGDPWFVNGAVWALSAAFGKQVVLESLGAVPAVPLAAACSGEHLAISGEAALAPHAARLAGAGWRVVLCDPVTFDLGVEARLRARLEAIAAVASCPPTREEIAERKRSGSSRRT
ncbi:MAG TPA: hypothetical protein VFE30_05305 [Anaeromyxobacteraceae bacterium]|jgi:hypothetical protein|nr:hypothetical protein [Anaeromyxobacteraceae bacterium]